MVLSTLSKDMVDYYYKVNVVFERLKKRHAKEQNDEASWILGRIPASPTRSEVLSFVPGDKVRVLLGNRIA